MLVSRSTFSRSVPVTVSVSIGPEAFAAKETVYGSVTPRPCRSRAASVPDRVLISTSAVTTSEPPALEMGLPNAGASSATALESISATELCDW